ncbi:MAG: hypothetical protein FWF68_08435, partial [Spirochaetes bacterium]|nr:hypothetical protein [Spirochaetota bacterium]
MSFLDKIIPCENRTLDALKNDSHPLFLWGCGELAERVYGFCGENGIRLSGVFVNIVISNRTFHGMSVLDLEEVCRKYQSFNVFVGHLNGYRTMSALKNNVKNINEIYSLDFESVFKIESIDYGFIVKNIDLFEWTYNQLSDELSKQSYVVCLNAKISRSYEAMIPYICENFYFCDDIVKLTPDEIFVDCGAFTGDTIKDFVKNLKDRSIQDYKRIYAFEPDEANYSELLKLSQEIQNLCCIKKGVWSEQTTLRFNSGKKVLSSISDYGDTVIEVDTIDNIIGGGG